MTPPVVEPLVVGYLWLPFPMIGLIVQPCRLIVQSCNWIYLGLATI